MWKSYDRVNPCHTAKHTVPLVPVNCTRVEAANPSSGLQGRTLVLIRQLQAKWQLRHGGLQDCVIEVISLVRCLFSSVSCRLGRGINGP